jgi:formylglycine-generating enzyme required for sulfatase activity
LNSAAKKELTESTKIPNIDMVYVAGGTFTMGCTSEQGSDCWDWEKPAHQVTVSSFHIGKYGSDASAVESCDGQ